MLFGGAILQARKDLPTLIREVDCVVIQDL